MNDTLQQVQAFHEQTFSSLWMEKNSPVAIRMGLKAYTSLGSTGSAKHHQY